MGLDATSLPESMRKLMSPADRKATGATTRIDHETNFPNSPRSLIAANASVSDAKPERHEAPALGAAVQGKAESVHRVIVRFTGYRVRPLDPDNFAGSVKDMLDGLRHAALIPGDEPWRIKLETEQVKVASFKEERTELELIYQ